MARLFRKKDGFGLPLGKQWRRPGEAQVSSLAPDRRISFSWLVSGASFQERLQYGRDSSIHD